MRLAAQNYNGRGRRNTEERTSIIIIQWEVIPYNYRYYTIIIIRHLIYEPTLLTIPYSANFHVFFCVD